MLYLVTEKSEVARELRGGTGEHTRYATLQKSSS